MPHENRTDRELEKALKRLEELMTVPVVPGELRWWGRGASDALAALEEAWGASRERHRNLSKEILSQDVEMARRVEQLELKDERLDAELTRLKRSLEEVLERAAEAPGESRQPEKEAERVRQEFLLWIVDCRTLEKEVDTWFLEAYYRDRGAGD